MFFWSLSLKAHPVIPWISPLPICCIYQYSTLMRPEFSFAPWFLSHTIHSSFSCNSLLLSLLASPWKTRGFFLLLFLSSLSKSWAPASSLSVSSPRPLQTTRNLEIQKGLAWIIAKVSAGFLILGFWTRTSNAVSCYYRSDNSGYQEKIMHIRILLNKSYLSLSKSEVTGWKIKNSTESAYRVIRLSLKAVV